MRNLDLTRGEGVQLYKYGTYFSFAVKDIPNSYVILIMYAHVLGGKPQFVVHTHPHARDASVMNNIWCSIGNACGNEAT